MIGFASRTRRVFRVARVWLDAGDEDPFQMALLALAAEVGALARC